jgi:hypothetical protein
LVRLNLIKFATLALLATASVHAQSIYPPSPDAVSFSYLKGQLAPPFQNVILDGASGTVFAARTISNPGGWITVTPLSAAVPTVLRVSADPTGLAPGQYDGLIELSVPASASPFNTKLLHVRLTVSEPVIQQSTAPNVITHIAEGGAASGGTWYTSFTLLNPSAQKVRLTISFFSDSGDRLALPVNRLSGLNTGFYVDLDPNSASYVDTSGATPQTVAGWATVEWSPTISSSPTPSVIAVFAQHVPGRSEDYEAAVPMSSGSKEPVAIPVYTWDGSSTGVALANSSNKGISVLVVGRDSNGSVQVSTNLTLPAQSHTSFSVADRFPAMKNLLGTLVFTPQGLSSADTGGLSIVALRFNKTGSFTTIQAIQAR